MKRIVTALDKLNWGKRAYAVLLMCAMAVTALPAQTLTTLFSFDGTNGSLPIAALAQATNGDLYGTTNAGGVNGAGTVFKVAPNGTFMTLYSFCSQSGCADGQAPCCELLQATNGDLYGTTYAGGANNNANCSNDSELAGCGTVFKITPSGTLTTVYSFCSQSGCTDGDLPNTSLVQGTNGDFYGTASTGGVHPGPHGNGGGTVFKITPSGTLTTLHSFCAESGCRDGAYPSAGLVQAPNGDFYGTTVDGGAANSGTVFEITPGGTLTTLYSFCSQSGCTDGASPIGLIRATDGNFYGVTVVGGTGGAGTVFKITPGGSLTTLYSFCSQGGYPACTDGDEPNGLIQATNGDFYGTTYYGGANTGSLGYGDGTVFEITLAGVLTTVYSFCSQAGCADGELPHAGLVQDTNGDFYGTTYGVPFMNGTAFRLSIGLGPFVETQTTSGKVGEVVKILGADLTGAASVSFNGTAAAFTVVAPSLITATVPAGATSGKVRVVTPSGTLSSNVPFLVLP